MASFKQIKELADGGDAASQEIVNTLLKTVNVVREHIGSFARLAHSIILFKDGLGHQAMLSILSSIDANEADPNNFIINDNPTGSNNYATYISREDVEAMLAIGDDIQALFTAQARTLAVQAVGAPNCFPKSDVAGRL